jgi:hypothetical protein
MVNMHDIRGGGGGPRNGPAHGSKFFEGTIVDKCFFLGTQGVIAPMVYWDPPKWEIIASLPAPLIYIIYVIYIIYTTHMIYNTYETYCRGLRRVRTTARTILRTYARKDRNVLARFAARTHDFPHSTPNLRTKGPKRMGMVYAQITAQYCEPTHATTETYWRGLRRVRTTARTVLRTHARKDPAGILIRGFV